MTDSVNMKKGQYITHGLVLTLDDGMRWEDRIIFDLISSSTHNFRLHLLKRGLRGQVVSCFKAVSQRWHQVSGDMGKKNNFGWQVLLLLLPHAWLEMLGCHVGTRKERREWVEDNETVLEVDQRPLWQRPESLKTHTHTFRHDGMDAWPLVIGLIPNSLMSWWDFLGTPPVCTLRPCWQGQNKGRPIDDGLCPDRVCNLPPIRSNPILSGSPCHLLTCQTVWRQFQLCQLQGQIKGHGLDRPVTPLPFQWREWVTMDLANLSRERVKELFFWIEKSQKKLPLFPGEKSIKMHPKVGFIT